MASGRAWPPPVVARSWPVVAPRDARSSRSRAQGSARLVRTLKAKRDFDRVFSTGVRGRGREARVVLSPSGEGRVAFVAGKRLGTAVLRNRCKRVLRACASEAGLPLEGCDVVLMATPKTARAPHERVVSSMRHALDEAERRVRSTAIAT